MTIDPLVSVIIPTYNRSQYICYAIDSVLAQTYENIEIIVVDDGSTDDTRDILQLYDSKIKYIFQNNSGPSTARNSGIKQANGDLIAFLDSDDIWLPEKLEYQVQLLEQSPDSIGLVACGYYIIDALGKKIGNPKINRNHKIHKSFLIEIMVHNALSGGGSGALVRRECFKKVGLFDEELWIGEDWDIWIRISKQYEIAFVESPLFKYRTHLGNLCNCNPRSKEDAKRIVRKNIEKRNLILLIKAYSNIYLNEAREHIGKQNRYLAFINALKSILIYPMKTHDGDNKYWILCKCLLPDCLISYVKKHFTIYKFNKDRFS
jgi:glycosyltransferase involved in cell wall biosynthesis